MINDFWKKLMRLSHYYSTHCLHGYHEMCKVTCKHCDEICKCEICNHEESVNAASQ